MSEQDFSFKDPEFDVKDPEVVLSTAEQLAAGVVDVLSDVSEIEIQAGSNTLFTKILAKSVEIDGKPGVAEVRTERFGAVTTFNASFESDGHQATSGERKNYQWDLKDESLVIRTTRPFRKGTNGKKHHGLTEARQVTLNPVVENNIQKIIDSLQGKTSDEEAVQQATDDFRDFLSGAQQPESGPEAKLAELYTRLMEACGGDGQRAEEIIKNILDT